MLFNWQSDFSLLYALYLKKQNNVCMSKATADVKLMVYVKYSYDALGKRIRLREFGSYNNKTFHMDLLLLYKQVVITKC